MQVVIFVIEKKYQLVCIGVEFNMNIFGKYSYPIVSRLSNPSFPVHF